MYFAVGSPKVYAVTGGAIVGTSTSPTGDVLAVLTEDSIQLWSAGVHRLCLGVVVVEPKCGTLVRCVWRRDGRRLCVGTTKNLLLCYELSPGSGGGGSSGSSSGSGSDREHAFTPTVRHYDSEGSYATHLNDTDSNNVWIDVKSNAFKSSAVLQLPTSAGHGAILSMAADAGRIYASTEGGRLLIFGWGREGVLRPVLQVELSAADIAEYLTTAAAGTPVGLHALRDQGGSAGGAAGFALGRNGTPPPPAPLGTSPVLAASPDPASRQESGTAYVITPKSSGVFEFNLSTSSNRGGGGAAAAEQRTTICTLHCSTVVPGEIVATYNDGSVAVLTMRGELPVGGAVRGVPNMMHARASATAAAATDGDAPAVVDTTTPAAAIPEVAVDGALSKAIPGVGAKHITALNSRKRLLAMSHGSGVALHDIDSPLHVEAKLGLAIWGWSADETGEVTSLTWSPDEEVLAVAYRLRGVAVFHWSGACVMTSLPRSGLHDSFSYPGGYSGAEGASDAAPAAPAPPPQHTLTGSPVQSMTWVGCGYHLLLAYARPPAHAAGANAARRSTSGGYFRETSAAGRTRTTPSLQRPGRSRLYQLEFARAVVANSMSLVKGPHVVMNTANAVCLYRYPELDQLQDSWESLPLPNGYISHAPLRQVSFSPDGTFLAASGSRGLTICNVALRKWRLFGEQEQEASIHVVAAPAWCTDVIVCVPARVRGGHAFGNAADTAPYTLLFYPRWHLDRSSLLLTIPLPSKPVLLDASTDTTTTKPTTTLLVLDEENKVRCYIFDITVDSVARPSKVSIALRAERVVQLDVTGPISMLRVLPSCPQGKVAADAYTSPRRGREAAAAGASEEDRRLPSIVVLTHKGDLVVMSLVSAWKQVAARRVCCFWVDPTLAAHGFIQLLVSTPKKVSLLALPHPHARRAVSGGDRPGLRRSAGRESIQSLDAAGSTPVASRTPGVASRFTLGGASLVAARDQSTLGGGALPVTRTTIQEADVDACPIGILASEGLLIHATEGVRTTTRGATPTFHVHVRSIPFLHAVLLTLFITQAAANSSEAERADAAAAAVAVAKGLKEHSFFVDVMDYLLHSILHLQDVVESPARHVERSAVLSIALKFLCNYDEFFEVLVHALRKADPGMWPLIFAQCPPLQLFNSALKAGRITESALLLRVLQMPVADDPSHELRVAACAARKLFPLTIASHKFELSAELVRFLKLLKGELLWDAADEEEWAAGEGEMGELPMLSPAAIDVPGGMNADMLQSGSPVAASPALRPKELISADGVVGDPLLDSRWLRQCVVRYGRGLLRRGMLCDLDNMLEALNLSTKDFIHEYCDEQTWIQDPAVVFAEIHRQYGLPFANATRVFNPAAAGDGGGGGGGGDILEVMGACATGHQRLFMQWRHAGGMSEAAAEVAEHCKAQGMITPTQVHLLLVPTALAAVQHILAACRAARCTALQLLLNIILGDAPAAATLAPACNGRALLAKCVADPRHVGYRGMLSALPRASVQRMPHLVRSPDV